MLDGSETMMQQYLIKADTQKGKYVCAKEDAIIQEKIQTRKKRCKHAREDANMQRQICARASARTVWKTIKGKLQR